MLAQMLVGKSAGRLASQWADQWACWVSVSVARTADLSDDELVAKKEEL